MDRIEKLRGYIDEVLLSNKNIMERRNGYIHLYGVSQLSVILAKKRNLNQEIAIMGGMLHDIYTYKFEYSKDHGEKGAVLAHKILEELQIATSTEIDIICSAIQNHSNKEMIDSEYDELLKDADVLQHCIYNPMIPVKSHELKRYNDLLIELDILFNKWFR